MSFPTITLKSGREKSVLNKHPWVFSGAVKNPAKAKDGEIVAVSSNKNEILGYGFHSPNSQIICRIFHFGEEEAAFSDQDFWMSKFQSAYALRKALVIDRTTNAYRLIHAEGDFLPGLIVDVYDNTAVVQLLIKGTEKLQHLFVACLKSLGINHVYFKSKSSSQRFENVAQESGWLGEEGETNIEILEHGLKFPIDIEGGQKTGFFIDQRENRLLLRKMSRGKKVLNTFCYTGGFSLYALAGGASEVVSVDISKPAIALCEATVASNFTEGVQHKAIAADCFEYLRSSEESFDIIVVDPPAFAKNARAVHNAARGYKDLNLLAFKKVKPQGFVMTYSCSQNISRDLFQKIVFSAAADSGRNVRIVQHLYQPEDHPINIFHPESEYLKGFLLWVE